MDGRTTEHLRRRDRAIRHEAQLAVLREQGDDLDAPREVDHFARFRSRLARSRFRFWLMVNGYGVAFQKTDRADMPRYCITFVKAHALDEGTLVTLTDSLDTKIASLNGVYEGWGCQPSPQLIRQA